MRPVVLAFSSMWQLPQRLVNFCLPAASSSLVGADEPHPDSTATATAPAAAEGQGGPDLERPAPHDAM